MTREKTETLKLNLIERIDALPQRDAIELSDINQWVDYVANVMPEEAMWHIARAAGIGGSEIGGLVKNYLGHRADFMFSAHDWAEEKLLRRHPEPSGGVLKRGIEMEVLHRQCFHGTFQVQRDVDAYRIISTSHSNGRPFLRYSPDDVVNFKRPTIISVGHERQIEVEGKVLLDYKSPSIVDENGASFSYACQLHQGDLIAKENGIELSTTILSQWDWANWTMYNDIVTIDPDLQDLILKTSDYYWDSVLRGEIPNYIRTQQYFLDKEVKDEWDHVVERFSMLNALKTQLDNEAKKLRVTIAEGLQLNKEQLGSQQLVFDGKLKISASTSLDESKVREVLPVDVIETVEVKNTTTSYDTAALVRYVKELGIDVKPFRKLTKLDGEKAYNALADHGFNPEEFMSETHRFLTDKVINTKAKLWVENNFPPIDTPDIPALTLTATQDSPAAQEARESQSLIEAARPQG